MAEERQKKIFLLRVIIASATVLIFALWLINLRNVSRYASENAPDEDEGWAQLRTDLNETLGDIQGQLDKVKADQSAQTKEESEAILSGVLAETGKAAASLATSTAIATSTIAATSTVAATGTLPVAGPETPKEKIGCPEYIDCMPTIGAARPCIVPAGCEGITTIAY